MTSATVVEPARARLKYCRQTLEFVPALEETKSYTAYVYVLAGKNWDEQICRDLESTKAALTRVVAGSAPFWLHLAGAVDESSWSEMALILGLNEGQAKFMSTVHERVHVEEYPTGFAATLKRCFFDEVVHLEVVNFCLRNHYVVTRQFANEHCFAKASARLSVQLEYEAVHGADEVTFLLIEAVLRTYISLMNVGSIRLGELQKEIVKNPGHIELQRINGLQQMVWTIWNCLWPIENILLTMKRSRNPIITERGRFNLEHSLEEASMALHLVEGYRDMSYDLMDVYVSGISLRTNNTTILLTIVATLFLPPTLIAGIYGMNFKIPELDLPFGYYYALGIMFAVSGGLLVWMKIKGFIKF